MDLPPPAAAKAKTADVDKMLASAARRMLGADATQTTYVSHDHLGSPSLETNERGGVVARRWHGPYGEVRGATAAWAETRGFTGKERDETTGLADHGARYLDTRLGRWTAPDPLAVRELGGAELDVYGYVEGRVTSEHDPDGQFGHTALGAAVGAFVGGAVEGARQFQSRNFDARALVTSIAGGAAVGGVAAATGGASLATQATVGAFTSAYVGAVSRAALGQKVTASTVAMDASMGAAAPALGKIVSAAASSATRRFRGAVESHRQAVASRFYRENAPWLDTEAKRLSHLNGIDFSKSVSVVRVRAGESFSQWQLPEATQGSYYAQLGDGPAGLGIKTAGRIRADYVATEETHALRSTAKTVTVDWDGPVEAAEGGRAQFFAPDRNSFKKVSGE